MIFKTTSFVIKQHKCGESKILARNILKYYLEQMSEDNFKRFLVYMLEMNWIDQVECQNIFTMATKQDKMVYPRISTMIEQQRQSMNMSKQQKTYC